MIIALVVVEVVKKPIPYSAEGCYVALVCCREWQNIDKTTVIEESERELV